MKRTNVVFYHKNCFDGSMAAAIAYDHFKGDVVLHPIQYGESVPYEMLDKNVILYVLDFSFGLEELQKISDKVFYTTVIDHHVPVHKKFVCQCQEHKARCEADPSVIEGNLFGFVSDLSDDANDESFMSYGDLNITYIIDGNESGASLTWKFFNKGLMPYAVQMVKDRDLWRFDICHTRAYTEYLGLLNHDIKRFVKELHGDYMEGIEIGQILLDKKNVEVEKTLKNVKVVKYKDYTLGLVNSPTNISEVGEAIYNSDSLNVDFAGMFFVLPTGEVVLSLRSKGDFDVAKIAQELGGNGHKNAAGCKVSLEFIADLYKAVV